MHTQPEGGNAIKYAKFYGSANENSKRQSVDKTEKEMDKEAEEERGCSPQCRYVCAQRRMPMHITPYPPHPLWLWENMSVEARDMAHMAYA